MVGWNLECEALVEVSVLIVQEQGNCGSSCRQFFSFSSAARAMVLGCVSAYASFISSTSNR